MIDIIQKYIFGDQALLFFRQDDTIACLPVPADMVGQIPPHRTNLAPNEGNRSYGCGRADLIDSMVQLKLNSDAAQSQIYPGRSMRNSSTVLKLNYLGTEQNTEGVVSRFRHPAGLLVEQVIAPGDGYFTAFTRVTNQSENAHTLEYLAAISLGMLSPFAADDGYGRYFFHRFQSTWAAEGRPLVQNIEELNMEECWSGGLLRNFRFGQRGTMPVRDFFPFVAFEDRAAGVFWGVQAVANASWELEVARTYDSLNISGGFPGRETDGWTKTLAPGETIRSMTLVFSCVKSACVDALCRRLLKFQYHTLLPKQDLSVIFNEYCSTWGKPWERNLMPLLEPVKKTGAKYFVLDAGWFRKEATQQSQDTAEANPVQIFGNCGDWTVQEEMYPNGGFDAMLQRIRDCGMIPGIWFEFEIALDNSETAQKHPEWFLTLDGYPIRHGNRLFLDFRKPEVITHVREKVCAFLKKHNIGYMKVDYNGTTAGICDGPESPAENHRHHMEGVARFFREVKETLPDLVLEICASGGYRLTPAWAEVADMFSFSDAHEVQSIPLIAASVQRMVPAYKSQVWATLRPWNDENRLFYLLCAGFLGRLSLSGNIDQLDEKQMETVQKGVQLYSEVAHVIANGDSVVDLHWNNSHNHPEGWQKVTFSARNRRMTVIHTFAKPPSEIVFKVESNAAHRLYAPQSSNVQVKDGEFCWKNPDEFSALIFCENAGR